ncbi:MAG: hypothetical protein GX295_00510 [Syntrophomonadaceae bacterium]|nr:hypothetical protein [Syntrophomonadaceae bacterium]
MVVSQEKVSFPIPDVLAWEMNEAKTILTNDGFKVVQVETLPFKKGREFKAWRVVRLKSVEPGVVEILVAPMVDV